VSRDGIDLDGVHGLTISFRHPPAYRAAPKIRPIIKIRVPMLALFSAFCFSAPAKGEEHKSIAGIYPHLTVFNNEGECGIGGVVPWADRLWIITYGPHRPLGSSDKLYEITTSLEKITRPESIGGTVANRMIHRESNQLFLGPYAIDAKGGVRAIPYERMPGRHTGTARHLFEPAKKVYFATMEEGLYSVEVDTLEVEEHIKDGNKQPAVGDGSGPNCRAIMAKDFTRGRGA